MPNKRHTLTPISPILGDNEPGLAMLICAECKLAAMVDEALVKHGVYYCDGTGQFQFQVDPTPMTRGIDEPQPVDELVPLDHEEVATLLLEILDGLTEVTSRIEAFVDRALNAAPGT